MKTELKLGQIITEPQNRDAIHIAVTPMSSDDKVFPGEHVGILPNGKASATVHPLVGVVDPFLRSVIYPGKQFWLMLYPQTITGLRHEWTHPAFPDNKPDKMSAPATAVLSAKEQSEAWLFDVAEKCGVNYMQMMHAAERGDYIYMGQNERYKDAYDCNEFVKHFKIVTGKEPLSDMPFSCSC